MGLLETEFHQWLKENYLVENLTSDDLHAIKATFYSGISTIIHLFDEAPKSENEALMYVDDIYNEVEQTYLELSGMPQGDLKH